MEQFFFNKETGGVVSEGRPISNFVVREVSRAYTPRGYEHSMEATILGATIQFTLSAEERNNPAAWVSTKLGPGAAWDEKSAPLLLASIARASEVGFDLRAEQKPEFVNSPEGLRHNGLLLTNAQLQSVRKVAVKVETGFVAPGMPVNGVEKRTCYEVTWLLHNGQTKRTVITPSDLTNPSGIVAALSDGTVCHHPMRLACHLGKLIQEAE